MPEFGDNWRKRIREEIPYYFAIEAQGECLPREENHVKLDPEKKDAWGIPVLHISATYGENEKATAAARRGEIGGIADAMKVAAETPLPHRMRKFRADNVE